MDIRNLKFCPNLNFMYTEFNNIVDKFHQAKESGFIAVEYSIPYKFSVEELKRAKDIENMEVILINTDPGDIQAGQLGYAALIGKTIEFEASVKKALQYATAVNCKKIHIMSGKVDKPTAENFDQYERNLRYAVQLFARENIVGVIEPIYPKAVPNYFLNNYNTAIEMIDKINSPNLKLMLDIFHLQQIEGNLTENINKYRSYIGHIQIAQVPTRHGPDSEGEINYKYIFKLLDDLSYKDYIGLEYVPYPDTCGSLKWLSNT